MKHVLLATAAALALAVAPAAAQQKTVKIGFIGTFSGPAAALGNDMRNSFELGLDQLGRKLGGLPVEVIYEDDQIKPEVGVQKTQKLIESDKVDFLVGYIWSNVLLASLKPRDRHQDLPDHHQRRPVADRRRAVLALRVLDLVEERPDGRQAVGLYMNQEGLQDAVPDRAELRRRQGHARRASQSTYKGQVVGKELTRWPDQLDFSAELAKARAAKPDAIFAFYPGARRHAVPHPVHPGRPEGPDPALHRVHGRRDVAAAPEGARARRSRRAAVGQRPGQRRPTRRYVADYKAKNKTYPSFYGAQTYDAVNLIDSARQGGQRRPLQEGRDAQGDGKGRLQVGARRLQVRQEPHPDPELLPAGRGEVERRLRR